MAGHAPSWIIWLFQASMLLHLCMATDTDRTLNKYQPVPHPSTDKRKTLYIIGLFAMSGPYPAGLGYLPAALLAVQRINNDPTILKDYKLHINAHNSNCSEAQGLNAFYEDVYTRNTSIMVLGGTCSHVTEATSQVSNLWNLLQISYSAVSPHLSNTKIFPAFYRVMTPEQNLTRARVELLKAFGWNKVFVIYQDLKLFSSLFEYIKLELERANITVENEMFTSDPTPHVKKLKEADARIIIGSMYEQNARQVMCAAYDLESKDTAKPWYDKVVWILPSFYDHHWMEQNGPGPNCTAFKTQRVLKNYFSVGSEAFYHGKEKYTAVGNLSSKDFQATFEPYALFNATKNDMPEFLHYYEHAERPTYAQHRVPEAYDAVWAIALALNNSIEELSASGFSLENFTYNNTKMAAIIKDKMGTLRFNSVTGPFFFNENGDRIPQVEISHYEGPGKFRHIGSCRVAITSRVFCGQSKSGNWRCKQVSGLNTWSCAPEKESDGSEELWECEPESNNCSDESGKNTWNCRVNQSVNEWDCSSLNKDGLWPDGRIPVDMVKTKRHTIEIDPRIRVTFMTLATCGIIVSLCLLVFNVIKRNNRIVKMSSPRLNNVILVGCVISYSTIVATDMGGSGSQFSCISHTFFLALSFSLSFGALFAKTWRVYTIFTAGHRVLNTRVLRDSILFFIVGLLAAVNVIVLMVWAIVSPQSPVLIDIGKAKRSEREEDELIQERYQKCDSEYRMHFTAALFAIQGVVILFGTFLAIQTRKVTFPEMNESKWIALCIYNVVVLAPVGVVVVLTTDSKPDVAYALEATILILITFVTECLLFAPKMISYRKYSRSKSSSKMKIKLKLHQVNSSVKTVVVDKTTKISPSPDDDTNDISGLSRTEGSVTELEDGENVTVNTNTDLRRPERFIGKSLNTPAPNSESKIVCAQIHQPDKGVITPLPEPDVFVTPASIGYIRDVSGTKDPCNKRSKDCACIEQVHLNCLGCPEPHCIIRSHSDTDLHTEMSSIISTKKEPEPGATQHSSQEALDTITDQCTANATDDIVMNTLEVKADVKVRSKFGFKASWKERKRNNMTQNEQIFQLLNLLREAVDMSEEESDTKA